MVTVCCDAEIPIWGNGAHGICDINKRQMFSSEHLS